MKSWTRFKVVALAGACLAPAAGALLTSAPAAATASVVRPASWGSTHCYGVYPVGGSSSYTRNCYGHDEPALDPISTVPGSGQDVTWTIKLPVSSSARSLLDLGPTFWIGATLNDPSSIASRVFSELQFYPDSVLLPQTGTNINTACTPLGFNVNPQPGTWSICDFSWGLYGTANPATWSETAAYVKVVDLSTNAKQPLYLHSGDTVTVHIFNSGDANNDAEQVITDVTTGKSGTLNMFSGPVTGAGSGAHPGKGDGPLTLPYSTNSDTNSMPWGVVAGTPFAFSWEIGHSNFYTHPTQGECVPGQWDCYSYNTTKTGWGAVTPLEVESVTFGVNGHQIDPSSWGTNDSQGGSAEDDSWCGAYAVPGSSSCTFPWYTYNSSVNALELGNNYPGTTYSYGGAQAQYATSPACTGPLTAKYGFLYYCDTTLNPTPPIG